MAVLPRQRKRRRRHGPKMDPNYGVFLGSCQARLVSLKSHGWPTPQIPEPRVGLGAGWRGFTLPFQPPKGLGIRGCWPKTRSRADNKPGVLRLPCKRVEAKSTVNYGMCDLRLYCPTVNRALSGT